ncbi:MAG: AsmA family protein [Rubrivivax sp.]
MKGRSSRRGLAIAAGIAGAIVLLLAAGEISGWPFLRSPLQSALTSAAKVPVKLEGDFHTRFIWRPMLQVGHLNVASAPGVQGSDAPHLLDATGVDLRWSWLDIWRWRGGAVLRLQRLHATTLDGRLLRDADGRATWQIGPEPDPKAVAEKTTRPLAETLPRVGSLQVGQGILMLTDQITDTDLKVEIDGGETGSAAGGYRARVQGRLQKLPLDLKLTSGAVLPLLADADGESLAEGGVDFSVNGTAGAARIGFEGRAAAVLGARQLSGHLRFSGPSLAQVGEPLGITLPRTPPFDLEGQLAHDNGVWQLKADTATIGSSSLNGEFNYDTTSAPPRLTGRLGGKRLALADLGPAVGTPSTDAEAPVTAASDRVLPDRRFDLPSLRIMDADVQVAIDELDLGSDAITPLHGLKSHLTLKDGVLRLHDLSAEVGGGQFDGSSMLDARDGSSARWALKLQFTKVDIARWVKGLQKGDKPKAEVSAKANDAYLTGSLNGNLDVSGTGNSTAEIVGDLDGSGKLQMDKGTISHLVTEAAGLDLAQALGVFVSGDEALPMRCARADFSVTKGTVKIERLVIDNADSTIRAAGRINLQEESLALMAASRPKDFSPLSLNSTVTITGKLKSPSIGIDVKRLTAKAAGAAVLGAVVGPLAALLPFIELGTDDPKVDVCAVRPTSPPGSASAVGSIGSAAANAKR